MWWSLLLSSKAFRPHLSSGAALSTAQSYIILNKTNLHSSSCSSDDDNSDDNDDGCSDENYDDGLFAKEGI